MSSAPDAVKDAAAGAASAASAAKAAGSEAPADNGPSKSELKRRAKTAERELKAQLKQASKDAASAQPKAAGKAQGKAQQPKKAAAEPVEEPPYKKVAPGEKKDLSAEMAAGYNPVHVEQDWYAWWNENGFFKPMVPKGNEFSHFADARVIEKDGDHAGVDPKKTFVIPSPPPNVTGKLHIGHALSYSLQDVLIRWYRMSGYTTLYVPGFDHAGISTQSVVESKLRRENTSRHDLGREKFVERCMDWKEEYQANITSQIQRLGASCDWSRVAFTMDENLSRAVKASFVEMLENGLIYRANRLVNWSTALQTTVSNLEVEQKELKGRTLLQLPGYAENEKAEFGVITSFAYEVDGSDERIVVATTRPETLFGDTAIAVHPDDARYKHLHGKYVKHMFVDRKLPIVTDSEAVDMSFGTGAVKITPAHDPNDFETGLRNKLQFINVLNDDGTLNKEAGEFAGLKRFVARRAVTEALEAKGLLVGKDVNPMTIPLCAKSGDVIENVLKPQWWVKCQGLADEAIARTKRGELNIRPESSESEWYSWLSNVQDWCISRQLWWGHRVPAYYVKIDGESRDALDSSNWVAAISEAEALAKAEKRFPGKSFTLHQDEDVLDTWFSSGLWPFSTLGWPAKTADLDTFYPTTLLETGWDILFFWVARMVFFGISQTSKMPFSEVFCHAMIRDAHGRKMSKSLGNVIDPIDVIQGAKLEDLHKQLHSGNLDPREVAKAEQGQKKDFPRGIPQCGSDALRFALCAYTAGGRDINLEILRVEGYRKFANKIWNATKFVMLKIDPSVVRPTETLTGEESFIEKWILNQLAVAAAATNKHLEGRHFMAAANEVHNFWLHHFCDIFIEATKPAFAPEASTTARVSMMNTLYTVLDNALRLLHPFMPFVTEELWQRLGRRANDTTPSIILAKYPTGEALAAPNDTVARHFDVAFDAVRAIRGIATRFGISHVEAYIHVRPSARDPHIVNSLQEVRPALAALIKNLQRLDVAQTDSVPDGATFESIDADVVVYVATKGLINADKEIKKANDAIRVELASADKIRQASQTQSYQEKTPQKVKDEHQRTLDNADAKVKDLKAWIQELERLA